MVIIFQVTLIIEAIAIYITLNSIFVELMTISGIRHSKGKNYLFRIYFLIVFTINQVLAAFYIKIDVIEGRLYMEFPIWIIILIGGLLLIPQFLFFNILIRKINKVYEVKLQYILLLFIVTLLFYLGSIFFLMIVIETRFIFYYLLIGSLIVNIVLIKKFPDLIVQLGFNFAFKNLFLIRNNGQTIYSQEFGPQIDEIQDKTMIQYLIGGFIYAITSGIKKIIKEENNTQLRTMDFGKVKMLFHYGNHIFGVLFTREVNNFLYKKLKNIIEEFELTFKKFLENAISINLMDGQVINETDKENLNKLNTLLKKYF